MRLGVRVLRLMWVNWCVVTINVFFQVFLFSVRFFREFVYGCLVVVAFGSF